MLVFLLFEMFYFLQFLTYQVCGLLSRLPVKSSTLWWNQQYEQVLNIGEICCDLLEISYLCGRINNKLVNILTKRIVVICSKFPTFVVESTTATCLECVNVRCDLLEISYLCGRINNKWPQKKQTMKL